MSKELSGFLGGDLMGLPTETAANSLRAAANDRETSNAFIESLEGREWLKFAARQQRWMFGKHRERLGDDRIAVHPGSFKHGWCAWSEGVNLGEVMVPLSKPLPDPNNLPEWSKKGKLSRQYQVDLQPIEGEHEGIPMRFRSNSFGGVSAVQDLMGRVADRLSVEDEYIVPLVILEADAYEHDTWGPTANPVFKIVGWLNAAGEEPPKKIPRGQVPEDGDLKADDPMNAKLQELAEDSPEEGAPQPIQRRR